MKKTRILALVIAVLALVSVLFLVSCKDDTTSGDCSETGEHKWTDWKSNGDATCTEDGTRYRRCPVCKKQETEPDAGTATGHYFLETSYKRNDDATCTTDGTETAVCYLCEKESKTRPAENSALGHRYGNNPVADKSHNGYNVFVCLRDGCGHEETFDNGTIDEDFEYIEGAIEDNSKRYFATNTVANVVEYADGEGKYLMLTRSAEKIVGNTAFGIFFTPDYDIYKSKDYVLSYDLLITETTRDLILLEGKKVSTEQVFATYDYETGKIMVNGIAAYTVTKGEWINVAFVLDDVNGEFDLYINKSLVISKATYDKKDTYYLAAELEYLGVRMIAEPKVASEFGIDNVKTYVGKAITDPAAPSVKENITAPVAVPHDIMGTIDMDWFNTFKADMQSIDTKLTDEKYNNAFSFSQVQKDGQPVNTVVWQKFSSACAQFNIKTFQGIDSYETVDGMGKTVTAHDISEYDSVTFTFYCDTTENMPNGYTVLVALYCPNVNENGSAKSSYFQSYYTFTAEDVINGEDGWKTVTISFDSMGKTRNPDLKKVTYFNFTASGWAPTVANNGVAVDGTVVKIAGVTFNKNTNVTYTKPAEDCEHNYVDGRVVAPTCLTAGFEVKECTKCGGEQPDVTNYVPALGHNYATIQDIAATCEENGYYSEKCLNCNDKVRIERPATGHTESTAEGYEAVVTAPTCYSTGYTTRTCGVCAKEYVTDNTAMIDHEWNEGEVTTEATCTEAGVTTYTCIHNGENGCDGTKTEAIAAFGHTADETQNGAYVYATCVKGGYTPTKCATCGVGMEIANEEAPATGHDWGEPVADSEFTFAPTCSADGSDFYVCSVCEETKTEAVTERPEHSVNRDELITVTPATCTTKGVGNYKCINCDFVETVEIDVVPHTEDTTFEPVVTAPVCGVDGYTTRKCSVCAQEYKTDIVEAKEHSDGGVEHTIQIADCVNDGWEKYTCVDCNVEVIVGEITPSKGGHKYETVIDDEDKALRNICTECGDKTDPTVDKMPTYAELVAAVKNNIYCEMTISDAVGTVSTSTKEYGNKANAKYVQFCIKSGAKLQLAIKDNGGVDGIGKYVEWRKTGKDDQHSYINPFATNAIPLGGKAVFEMALRLGEPGANGEYISSDFQLIDRSNKASSDSQLFLGFATLNKNGTITFQGSTYVITLSQEKFTKIALAFDFSNNKMDIYVDGVLVNNTSTIFNADNVAKYDMTKFHFDEIRMLQFNKADSTCWFDVADIVAYGGDMPNSVLGVDYCTIKGEEHNYVAGTPVAPDCYNDGYTPYTCEYCGDVQNRDIVAKLAHVEEEMGEEYMPNVVAPTCFTAGYTKRLCKACGDWYETDPVEKLTHVWGETATESVPAQCLVDGYAIYTCTNPGCTETDRRVLTATGHSEESTVVGTVAPTCTDGGYTVKNCPTCKINYKVDELDPKGHEYGDFVTTLEPTCTEKGKQERKCNNCIWVDSKAIDALGHDYVIDAESELTFAATCYADGSNFYACSRCDATKTEAVTTRPAHTWGDYEVETAPTCTDAGREVRTCTVENCGATSDRVITALGHELDEGKITTAPTCTENGIRTFSCTRECGYTEEVVESALGHDMVLDPENNTFNCTTDGVLATKCQREGCTYTETEEKAATGHKFQPDQGESEWTVVTPATCYSEGVRTRPCLNAGCTETEPATIKMIDHVMGDTLYTFDATEEADGYTYYKCNNEGCTHYQVVDVIPAITSGTKGFVFTEVTGGYYIIAYEGTDTEVIIPATYKGVPVIGIDPAVFTEATTVVTGITIESADLFTYEDQEVFNGLELDYVVVKAGVAVPDYFFFGAAIGTVYIEEGASVDGIEFAWSYTYEEIVYGTKE